MFPQAGSLERRREENTTGKENLILYEISMWAQNEYKNFRKHTNWPEVNSSKKEANLIVGARSVISAQKEFLS